MPRTASGAPAPAAPKLPSEEAGPARRVLRFQQKRAGSEIGAPLLPSKSGEWMRPAVRKRPACPYASVKSVYFIFVQATLTELRRDTSRVVRPVIHGGKRLTLTEHGQPCAEIVPLRKLDRKALCQALIDLGPIDLPRSEERR